MKSMVHWLFLLLALAAAAGTACAAQGAPGKRLVFYPELKSGERKEFVVYLGAAGAPLPKEASGVRYTRGADGGIVVENGVIRTALAPDGSLAGLELAGGSKLAAAMLVAPHLLYNPGTGITRLVNPKAEVSVLDGPAALQVVATGVYAGSGHQWRRSYLFFRGDFFRVEDTFRALNDPPAGFKSNILFSVTRAMIGGDPADNLLAWQDGRKEVLSGVKPEDPSKDMDVVPAKWSNIGTWQALYSPKENTALGTIFTFRAFEMLNVYYFSQRKFFAITDTLNIPVGKDKEVSTGQYVTLKRGDYRPVQELAGLLTEPVAFKVSPPEEKGHSAGGFSWTHRVALSLNNYVEKDRAGEPFFLPLDKLGVDWSKFSPQSIRISVSEPGGRNGGFIPCQVIE